MLGLSPQMTLEALIASNNGFNRDESGSKQASKNKISNLYFWKLTGGENIVDEKSILKKDSDVNEILEEVESGLKDLINIFNDESTAYLSCPNPDKAPKYNDYEHLQRIKEYS